MFVYHGCKSHYMLCVYRQGPIS